MYSTSTAYKTSADQSGRTTKISIDYGDVQVSSENVLSYFKFLDELITDEKKSIIGAFPGAKINYTMIGNQAGYIFPSSNRTISIITSLLVNGSYEDVPLGTFIVTDEQTDNVTDEISIEAMDSSVLFDKPYALETTWPKTAHDWAQEICSKVGIELGSTSWLNSTISIPEVVMDGSYRDAIKFIAAAGGCFAHMGRDNKLYFRTLTTVTRDFLEVFEYSQGENYGPVNSLVLTKDPTNDNVAILDQPSIVLNGKTEVQIDNNPILETDRETLITPLFEAISGLTFAIASIEYTGDPSVELGDIVRFLDQNSALQNLTVLSIQFDQTGSWGGTLAAIAPSKTDIETDYAGTYDKRIKRTEINVDKVKQEITIVASNTSDALTRADAAQTSATSANNSITLLTPRVTAAELKITPTAITSTVEENTTTLATKSLVTQTAESTKIAAEQQIRDEYGDTISNIETNFIFDQSGLTISKSTSDFAVKISDTEMGFYDGPTKTAYVSGGEFLINKGTVISSLTIGSHKIERYSSGITIFRFIG